MRLILATTLVLALAACGQAPAPGPQVGVEDAFVTLPAVRSRPGAGYFTVRAGSEPTRLTGVASPRVQRIELHDMTMAGGVMQMGPLRDTRIPAKGALTFAPGGKHAMLFGIDPALKPGDRLALTFSFEGAPAVTVQAEVRGPGGGSAH